MSLKSEYDVYKFFEHLPRPCAAAPVESLLLRAENEEIWNTISEMAIKADMLKISLVQALLDVTAPSPVAKRLSHIEKHLKMLIQELKKKGVLNDEA